MLYFSGKFKNSLCKKCTCSISEHLSNRKNNVHFFYTLCGLRKICTYHSASKDCLRVNIPRVICIYLQEAIDIIGLHVGNVFKEGGLE